MQKVKNEKYLNLTPGSLSSVFKIQGREEYEKQTRNNRKDSEMKGKARMPQGLDYWQQYKQICYAPHENL